MSRTVGILGMALAMMLLGAAPLAAVEVYLNGVQITGAKDQVIEKAKVVLDKNGDIYITAPEYKVQELGASHKPPATPPPTGTANLSKKYFVVTDVARLNATGYGIKVMVNSKFIKELSEDVPQTVLELNGYLAEGANAISFMAVRPQGKSSPSGSASDTFSVVIGVGKGDPGGQLVIDDVLAEFKVSAADAGEKAQTFTITAK